MRMNRGRADSLSARPKKQPRIAGLFFGPGGERGLGENPWFDKSRSDLDRKMLPAFSAYGTSLCLTAAGAFRPYGSDEGHDMSRNRVLSASLSIQASSPARFTKYPGYSPAT